MDRIEMAAYTRSWRTGLFGSPSPTAGPGRTACLQQTSGARRTERKEEPRQRSMSLCLGKTCPTNGGKISHIRERFKEVYHEQRTIEFFDIADFELFSKQDWPRFRTPHTEDVHAVMRDGREVNGMKAPGRTRECPRA